MDQQLELTLPPPLLSGPFTPSLAASVGVGRPALERMLRAGVLRRMRRGVYVDTQLEDTVELRARALALQVAPEAVVVDRTAAWLHGIAIPGWDSSTVDALGRRRPDGHFGARRPLAATDVVEVESVRATSVLRTLCDLGRLLGTDRALVVLDQALHRELCGHRQLILALPAHGRLKGGAQLRRLVALADGRAASAAESVLRLRWLRADLPTPVPHLRVAGPDGRVELTLGLPLHRFGIVLGQLGPAHSTLLSAGWRLVPLTAARVLGSDAELVQGHLSREYHRHLLGRAG